MAPWDRRDSETASTIVGSENGHRLSEQDDATEGTGLLSAGAQQHDGAEDSPLGESIQRKDSWVGMQEFEGLPWHQRPSVWWLLWPYAIFTLAFGGVVVPKMNLIITLVCHRYYKEQSALDPNFSVSPIVVGGDITEECLAPNVQRNVAAFTLTVGVISGILSAITAPKLGALSDRYGRKRLLVICSFGGIVGEVITILAANFPDVVHYNWLLLGAFFDGLTGSLTAGSVITHAYTSDCTPPSKRSVAFGYLHACLFVGLSIGPLLTGYFVEWTGSLVSLFYVTLGCHITFILFIYFVIPESLSKSRQKLARNKWAQEQARKYPPGQEPAWMRTNETFSRLPLSKPIGKFIYEIRSTHIFAPLKILFPTGPDSKKLRRNLLTLAIIDMSILGAAMGSGSVMIMYTEAVFGWRNLESSKFVSLVSIVRVFVLAVIFPFLNYWFRVRPAQRKRRESGEALVEKNEGADAVDIGLLRLALISDVIGITGYIFARTSKLFVLCAIITALGGLGSATIQAAITKHVPAENVGQLLGAIGLLHALARIFLPILFNGVYAFTVGVFPQAFIVLLAAVFWASLFGSFLVRTNVFMKEEAPESSAPASPLDDPATNREIIEEDEIITVR